ncbi:MFS transporter [Novosphingobium profundi]|uniref:AmpG family muropeptide MFS transporter n=1 Tax=Novosphingobium profundi TaxID=1774954 RepID=UPI001BD93058|nr:MFS transporter [Novosphingobium profundi]MBT0671266.1 MFS transporter [Novosphingobium profundi]
MSEPAATQSQPDGGWRRTLMALGNRKTGFMAVFGFASGLPFALFLGTLYAWLSEAGVDLETMGVFSLIGLAYAFQFLWSPLLDRVDIPGMRVLGKRKQWIVTAQVLLGVILVTLSALDPRTQLGWFSLLAAIGAFASATQDIVINAWRIDVADEDAPIDLLSTIYQMGYRLASLAGGALGLILAARIGWPQTYLAMGVILLAIGIAGLFAPDAEVSAPTAEQEDALLALRQKGELTPQVRLKALLMVGALWGAALATVITFMVLSMTAAPDARPDPTTFTATAGPLIVIATIVLPALIAGWLVAQQRKGNHVLAEDVHHEAVGSPVIDQLYRALLLPLVEFVGRLGWSLVLIIALVLTYRICDAIWGTFAYPFYLGYLKYANDEVAIASKFFGVGATVLGLAVGGGLLGTIGRMPTLLLGAVLAAVTNLLYADLASGGAVMSAVSNALHITQLVESFGGEGRLATLMVTIGAENLATGIAGAAYIAWLSSIVAKGYSAVQYALLSSLTLLVGTLGRGALGKMIENQGYHAMFIFVTWIGTIAIVLTCLEWWRQSRQQARRTEVPAEF